MEERPINPKPHLKREENSGQQYFVDIGQIKLGFEGDRLRISSLGSCIGLVLYPDDSNPKKCAIMGHIMLPQSKEKDRKNPERKNRFGPTRFADIAIPEMIKRLEDASGRTRRKRFVAKMIGGAEMFGYTKLTLSIGKENAKMTKALLKKEKVPIIKEFTGGDTGMSVIFQVNDYILKVKPTGGKSIII